MAVNKKASDGPATKNDIQLLKNELKGDLSQLEARSDNKIETIKNELKASKNEILNGQDEIIKQLADIRTEKLMMLSQFRRSGDQIANHEERIVRLEHKVLV